MNELKIDPELRDLLPPLSGDEKRQLEDNLLKIGYVGAPIYIWNGYIVDGHNRYEICQKHHITYPTEELNLGDSATKTDVMEWMINTQLGRRNLIPAQRLIVLDKFKKRVQAEAALKKEQSLNIFYGNQHKEVSHPNGEHTKIHTDKTLAKMAGVGTGTVARFNQVMKSEDENLKNDVIAGKVSINAGYKKIKEKKMDNEPEQQSELSKTVSQIASEMKNPRNISDYWNFTNEIECLQCEFDEFIDGAFDRLFGEFNISDEVLTQHEKENAIHCIDDFINKIQELKEQVEKVKVKTGE